MTRPQQSSVLLQSRAIILVTSVAWLAACSGAETGTGPQSTGGEAGSSDVGGTVHSGGSAGTSTKATGGFTGGGSGGTVDTGGASGAGGSSSAGAATTGGTPAAGGTSSTGGTMGTGGSKATGGAGTGGTSGTFATGGSKATGGTLSTGGTKDTGGSKATGGATPTGGTKASGGTLSTGGTKDTGGSKATGGAGTGGTSGTSCPYTGHITYTITKSANPTATEQTAYDLITTAMDKAIAYYNCYTNITKAENVQYVPSVATADANSNGSMRFGSDTSYMDYRTAMHEIAHTVGIGTAANWSSFVANGLFTGTNAAQQLQAINATLTTPLYTDVHADTQHFWPYGINYQSEVKSEADLFAHMKMVMAIRKDLGLQ